MYCPLIRKDQLDLLDKGRRHPLTLVVAAPGSGKSVLLRQWQAKIEDDLDEVSVLRLDLEPKLDDGLSVFKRIFDELKNIAPLWNASFFNLFKSESPMVPSTLVEALVQAFELVDHSLVIILDDFHHIKSKETQQVFSDLIPCLPSHIQLVLSSRMYPLFPLSRFKLEERVFVIDGNDLKLEETELVQLSQNIGGASLSIKDINNLLCQTEGWFVGVKLALLACNKVGPSALDSFSGSQPELLNYFAYEVLKNMDDELRKFVLSTVIFENFDKLLCEQVLDFSNVAAILDKAVMQELFLMPVPEKEARYRYHPLLQTFLLHQLEIEYGTEYIAGLHRQSAAYFLKACQYSLAIRHASKCGDLSFYYSVLSFACHHWLRLGLFESVIDSLSSLSDAVLEGHASLLEPLIYALSFSRRFNQAHYYLEILKRADSQCCHDLGSANDSGVQTISIDRFLEHILALFQKDTDALNDIKLSEFSGDHKNMDIRGFSMVILAYEKLYRGDLSEAFKIAHEAKALLSKIGHKFFASFADLIIILCDRYLGRGIDAIQYMNQVFSEVRYNEKTPVWVNISTGMMVVYYEQNSLNKAIDLGEKLLPLVNFSCVTEVVSTVYLYLSRLLHLCGNRQKASKLLEQLDRILSLGNYERLKSQLVQEKMRQALIADAGVIAEQIYTYNKLSSLLTSGVWREPGRYRESCERYGLTAVYYLVSKEKYDRANEILEQMVGVLSQYGLKTRALIASCNLLSICFVQGHTDVAINQLNNLIEQYGLVCFSRGVFDESPGLDKVFQQAINGKRITLPAIFIALFTDFLNIDNRSDEMIKPARVLTGKEMAVFELLSAGLSNAEISKQSDIALSTTKWHLKNIYTKLGVVNRSAAMRLAHQR
jgi:LuxR family maltose regulon positive regulatory protein